MTDLPDYAHATRDISHYEMLKQFARRMPAICPCTRKRLFKVWKGEAMDYHLMKCVRCGVSTIWPVDHHTGKVLMDKNFINPSRLFDRLVQFYKEAKQ